MIYNETRTFEYQLVLEEAEAVTGVGVTVYKSDNTTVSGTSATADPGTPATIQDLLSNAIPLTWAGITRTIWNATVNSQILHPNDYGFVSYTDIVSNLRLMTGYDADTLSDQHIDLYIARIVRLLELEHSGRFLYRTLTGMDQIYADEAITLLSAWYIKPDVINLVPSGELTKIDIGPDVFTFARSGVGKSINRDDWFGQALQLLCAISTMQTWCAQRTSGSFFRAVGRRRKNRENFGLSETDTPMYDLLNDVNMAWDWGRIYASYSS